MIKRSEKCCAQVKIAHILVKSTETTSHMLDDGWLRRIDTKEEVRSIFQYLESALLISSPHWHAARHYRLLKMGHVYSKEESFQKKVQNPLR